MNGAVSSQILAHVTHEKRHIFCFTVGTSSAVDAYNTVWEHVVAAFGTIALAIDRVIRVISGTLLTK